MRKVLVGECSALLRAGFDDILRHQQVQVLDTQGGDVIDRLVEALPDVVVLDLDLAETEHLVQRIVSEFPSLTVVACSAAHPRMRVYLPFHRGESYVRELHPDHFTAAVRA